MYAILIFYFYPYNKFLYTLLGNTQCLSSSINIYLTKIEVQMICILSYDIRPDDIIRRMILLYDRVYHRNTLIYIYI